MQIDRSIVINKKTMEGNEIADKYERIGPQIKNDFNIHGWKQEEKALWLVSLISKGQSSWGQMMEKITSLETRQKFEKFSTHFVRPRMPCKVASKSTSLRFANISHAPESLQATKLSLAMFLKLWGRLFFNSTHQFGLTKHQNLTAASRIVWRPSAHHLSHQGKKEKGYSIHSALCLYGFWGRGRAKARQTSATFNTCHCDRVPRPPCVHRQNSFLLWLRCL